MKEYSQSRLFRLIDKIGLLSRAIEKLGIKFKLISSFSLIVLFLFLVFGFISLRMEEKNLQKTTDDLCKSLADQMISSTLDHVSVLKSNDKKRWVLKENLLRLKKQEINGLLSMSIIDLTGDVAGLPGRYAAHFDASYLGRRVHNYKELKASDFEGRFEKTFMDGKNNIGVILYYHPFSLYDKRIGVIELSFSKTIILEPLERLRFVFLILLVVSVLFTIAAIFFMGLRITRPIIYLSERADIAAGGNLDILIEKNTHDEIGRLSDNFSNMLKSIKENQKALIEKERMEEELKIARDIQETLLPKELPAIEGMTFHASFMPHSEASGDYYDFLMIDENRLGIVVADVSGHGVGAGLVMAMTRAILRTHAVNEYSPDKLLKKINPWIHEDTLSTMFVTMFYGVLDVDKGLMKYTSAGHNQGLVYSREAKRIRILKPGGIPLGAASSASFDNLCTLNQITLKKGDVFLQYTDGVTEAQNADGEEFGEERLIESIRKSRANTPKELIEKIIDDLNVFMGKSTFHDDITLVSFSYDR